MSVSTGHSCMRLACNSSLDSLQLMCPSWASILGRVWTNVSTYTPGHAMTPVYGDNTMSNMVPSLMVWFRSIWGPWEASASKPRALWTVQQASPPHSCKMSWPNTGACTDWHVHTSVVVSGSPNALQTQLSLHLTSPHLMLCLMPVLFLTQTSS